jgi:hypothetical protein
MKSAGTLGGQIAVTERRLEERRKGLRQQGLALAAQANRRLSSPVVLVGAAAIGFVIATKRGRWSISRAFSLAQLGLAILSAAKR